MFMLFAWLACSSEPVPDVDAVQPVAAPDPAAEVVPADDPPPRGKIGGDPILPDPVVLGAISAQAVDDGIAAQVDAIHRCFTDAPDKKVGLSGKVLVSFTIVKDGTVSRSRTKSTSLRHEGIEECVNQRVAEARFPALESGQTALVSYPFAFPRS